MRCTIFPNVFGEEKQTFIGPTTIPVLQFYVKELLWNEKSREHRREKSFGVPSASSEQKEFTLSFYEEAEDRFVYDETNTGHEDAAEYLIRMT